MEYKNRGVAKLDELYHEYKDRLGQAGGMEGMFWKAFSPAIPDLLRRLDDRPDVIAKVKTFVAQLLKAFEEDAEDHKEITNSAMIA